MTNNKAFLSPTTETTLRYLTPRRSESLINPMMKETFLMDQNEDIAPDDQRLGDITTNDLVQNQSPPPSTKGSSRIRHRPKYLNDYSFQGRENVIKVIEFNVVVMPSM